LLGDFNQWTPSDMQPSEDGSGFEISLELSANQTYRFRYLLDGDRWENDWQADSYVPNEYGGDDSLVDLTVAPGALSASPNGDGHDDGAKPKRKRTVRKLSAPKTGTADSSDAVASRAPT
jgi:hypothetical protein